MVMGEVEKVAEVVEKVAEEAEKVSEKVAESIPDDSGKLKEAALWVEKASKATAHDAQLAQDLVHKVYIYALTRVGFERVKHKKLHMMI